MTVLLEAPKVAGGGPQLPVADPEEISPAWLTDTFQRCGISAPPITACRVERIAEGLALLSRVYRIHIRYETPDPAAPSTVVVKLPTDDPEQLLVAEVLGLYRREAFVYNNLPDRLPYRTPRCHLAVATDDGRSTTVILEDLGACRPVDQVEGAPWSVVGECVDALAAQHSSWCGDTALAGVGDALWPLTHPVYPVALPIIFEPGWAAAIDALGSRIGERLAVFGDRWSTVCGELLQLLGHQPTLLHGDFRADNLFYDAHELIVADFQFAGVGAGAYDLAYFVSQSVEPATRSGRDRELVERYVDALAANGSPRDFEATWDEFRATLLMCLVYPVAAFRSWETQPPRGRALLEKMFFRAAHAIEATDALALLE